MVKFTITLVFVMLFASCSGGKVANEQSILSHPFASGSNPLPNSVKKLWTHKIMGLMTDLDTARSGSAIIVASAPDHENVPGSNYELTKFDRNGKRLWKIQPTAPIKAQAISEDGSIVFISTYDDTISAIGKNGKTLWTDDNTCRPIILYGVNEILCYHDDDTTPSYAFEVYSFEGKKIISYPIPSDILSLRLSEDRKFFAVALTHGQVLLFDHSFKPIWLRQVEGEVVDLAVSSGENPRVGILTTAKINQVTEEQKLFVIDSSGDIIGRGKPKLHAEQLGISADGKDLFAYGNSQSGQNLTFFPVEKILKEGWSRGDKRTADYSSSMLVMQDLIVFGFEDFAANSRHSHLLAFDFDGNLKWNIPLVTEEGAYLYAQAYSPKTHALIVGTDDGYLNAYRLR